jgi:hypothetical protein
MNKIPVKGCSLLLHWYLPLSKNAIEFWMNFQTLMAQFSADLYDDSRVMAIPIILRFLAIAICVIIEKLGSCKIFIYNRCSK